MRASARVGPLPRAVVEPLAVAVVCGLATAPVVLLHFDRAPVYTVPANLLAFPALPAVLALGLLAALVDPVAPGAAAALAWVAGWAAAWLELVARLVASLPGAQVGARTALGAAVLVAVGWLAARRLRVSARRRRALARPRGRGSRRRRARGLVVGAPGPGVGPARRLPRDLPRRRAGRLVLLETPSARVLVDEGPPEADVAGQLLRMGVRSLSALVLTHPERDHVGGAPAVVRRLRVGAILDPALAATGPDREEAIAAAGARRVPVRVVRTGSEFRVGGLVLRALWPPDAGAPSDDPNLNAIVLLASYGETDVLLPADAESEVTARLRLPAVEVLKVAHHGSEDPGWTRAPGAPAPHRRDLLRPRQRVRPPACGDTGCAGRGPGLALYRTDEDGRVVVESDGRSLRVRTAK